MEQKMSHSEKFRQEILNLAKEGSNKETLRKMFKLGKNTIYNWEKLELETGSLANRKLNRTYKKINPEELKKYFYENNDAFDREAAETFKCTREAIRKARNKLNIIVKKKVTDYEERNEEDRTVYQEIISETPKGIRYYVDETGINQYYYRENGKATRGVKIHGKIKGKKYERKSIVAAKCGDKIVGMCEYIGTMNGSLFELWFVEVLLKEIPLGSVIILDRASFHRRKVLEALAEAAGCRVIFLPAYSPDFNPIEKVWANLKKFIKNYMKNFSTLSDAINHYFKFA
jgi:transposase